MSLAQLGHDIFYLTKNRLEIEFTDKLGDILYSQYWNLVICKHEGNEAIIIHVIATNNMLRNIKTCQIQRRNVIVANMRFYHGGKPNQQLVGNRLIPLKLGILCKNMMSCATLP